MIAFVSCNQEEYFNMVATSSVTEISSVPETVDEDFVLSALCDSVDLLNTRYGLIKIMMQVVSCGIPVP